MRVFLLLGLLFPLASGAVVVSRQTVFEPDTPAIADDLNNEFDNIISAVNGNLDGQNIAQNAIATGNLATASVTKPKLGALGQIFTAPPPKASNSTTTLAFVPNLTANITVDHRPVWVGLQPSGAGPGRVSYTHGGGGATSNSSTITFQRDFATVNQSYVGIRNITNPTNSTALNLPCSAFWFIDVPGGGPHNYTAAFQTATADSGIVTVENCILAVLEL